MFLFKKKSNGKKVTDVDRTRRIENDNNELSYQVGNLQRIGMRQTQEDSFALVNALDVNEIRQKGMFAIVADGMGGMKDGKLVSEAAVTELVQEFRNVDKEADIAPQLVASVKRTNQTLHNMFEGDGGTTVVFVVIYKGMAHWVSVGDSSIYLKRNGGIFKLNKDHTYRNKLYQEAIYQERIDKNKIEGNVDGARLSEFMGNSSIEEIDYNRKPLKLMKDDVILLCSDGVSNSIDEATLTEILASPPDIACNLMVKRIEEQAKQNQDNYTALVISCMK